jgi:hypothetical protein
VNSNLVLKLFPDILIYYGTLYFVVIVATVSKMFPTMNAIFRHRLNFLGLPKKDYCIITVGELFLGIIFLLLILAEFLYWFLDHGWEQTGLTSRTPQERAARALGQVRLIRYKIL